MEQLRIKIARWLLKGTGMCVVQRTFVNDLNKEVHRLKSSMFMRRQAD